MINHADIIDYLQGLPEHSVHAVVTDPPYGLEFMGRDWDSPNKLIRKRKKDSRHRNDGPTHAPNEYRAGLPFQSWVTDWANEMLRVVKPGAHGLFFGGTRTVHRLACGLEDAGWEIRDRLMWGYRNGFPKSMDIGKKCVDWNGWGTALKPAYEPIIMVRAPFKSTIAENITNHSTGGINIDATRSEEAGQWQWTENQGLGYTSGTITSPREHRLNDKGRFPSNMLQTFDNADPLFMVPKAGTNERFGYCRVCTAVFPIKDIRLHREHDHEVHPTVKPVSLMRHLVRLVTPPEGTVMDPFVGTGSTGVAARLEGFDFIGCDQMAEYVAVARERVTTTSTVARLDRWM